MKVLAAAAPLPQRSFFTHRIVDPIPAPIRQTESKMLGILRQKVGAGSSSAMILGQKILPATSAMRGFAASAKELLFIVRLKIKLIDFFLVGSDRAIPEACHREGS
ncbi:uncharacterized protein [Malus domestica]|uniref:uncharacterized protein isoform X16 n=1 Tax=Malus domestica TaxID=3750 RepID=UPI00397516DB